MRKNNSKLNFTKNRRASWFSRGRQKISECSILLGRLGECSKSKVTPLLNWHNFKANLVKSCLAICFMFFYKLWMLLAIDLFRFHTLITLLLCKHSVYLSSALVCLRNCSFQPCFMCTIPLAKQNFRQRDLALYYCNNVCVTKKILSFNFNLILFFLHVSEYIFLFFSINYARFDSYLACFTWFMNFQTIQVSCKKVYPI